MNGSCKSHAVTGVAFFIVDRDEAEGVKYALSCTHSVKGVFPYLDKK
jgi:hypothetical protein